MKMRVRIREVFILFISLVILYHVGFIIMGHGRGKEKSFSGLEYRVKIDEAVCQKYGLVKKRQRMLGRYALEFIIVDDIRKVMFCQIPKVASGNWKRVFITLNGDYDHPTLIPVAIAHDKTILKNLSSSTVKEYEYQLKHYEKYVIVREPMERLMSAYLNKIHRGDYTGKFHRLLGKKGFPQPNVHIPYQEQVDESEKISFSDFVDFIINVTSSKSATPLEIHWRRMNEICHPCLLKYDYIGRYERLNQDARHILDKIPGGKDLQFPDMRDITNLPSTKESMKRFFSQLTEKQLKGILAVYELDYLLFNYPNPKYLFDFVQKNSATMTCRCPSPCLKQFLHFFLGCFVVLYVL